MNQSTTPDVPWTELKLVLAVRREGSLRGAAKALRLSHATVSRRISELQEQLGVHLFEREGRALRLTVAGEDLAETAARIEAEVDGLGRRIAGQDHRLEGRVRVASAPAMLAALAPALPQFAEAYPGIELEWVTSLALASLTRREADVAIRQTESPQDTLVGRKHSLFEQAVYVRRSLGDRLRQAGQGDPLVWPWIDWDDSHSHHSSGRWVTEHVGAGRVVARCDSSLSMYLLIRAGLGVGFAPTMLASSDAELVRLEPRAQFPVFQRSIWVLTHPDLRRMGRIRATMQWLGEVLHARDGGVWTGVSPES